MGYTPAGLSKPPGQGRELPPAPGTHAATPVTGRGTREPITHDRVVSNILTGGLAEAVRALGGLDLL